MSAGTRRDFLRELARGAAALAASGLLARRARAAPAEKPNVVFVLIDDLGWADVGCNGSSFHETPNIDRLAREGMRFTDGYAACPVCSPTRASIMTGKYPARLHLTNFLVGRRWPKTSPLAPLQWQTHLPPAEVTLAEALKAAGYATCHIGKWHLGGDRRFWPEAQGFDVNIGGTGSGMPRAFFWPQWKGNPPIQGREPGEYLPDRLAEEAEKFIVAHKDHPFFLYLAHYAVHIPLQAKKAAIEKYRGKTKPGQAQNNPIYAGMVEAIDDSVGRVMRTLERLGISDNTIVFFMSDNGGLSVKEGRHTPATSNAPLRAGKGYLYEGGIREPWLVKWPGVVTPGTTCGVPVTSVDFYPTILEMVGLEPQPGQVLDGESIVPLLKRAGGLTRKAIYWHYPHYSNQGGRPGSAVRVGPWKLIERHEDLSLELYHLEDDIGETRNLAGKLPGKAKELLMRLDGWRQDVGAQMPSRKVGR